jgi:predicted CoA-binding protein|tara:strand:+ start:3078 stop:3461 length:384 start_codon:yes stop_codon:yes gene_type:complete
LIELLEDKNTSIALIGASNDPSKYGNKIFIDLTNKGFNVIPVNKKEDFIQNTKCYKSVEDIGVKPDILNFVVPPQIGYEMTKDLVTLGFNNFWYQPGAESESTSLLLKENNKDYIDDKCIMVEAKFN